MKFAQGCVAIEELFVVIVLFLLTLNLAFFSPNMMPSTDSEVRLLGLKPRPCHFLAVDLEHIT